MARVKCRCGESLKVTAADPDRLTCPRCGAKIRLRRDPARAKPRPEPGAGAGAGAAGDGFVRFYCPCGRRLKVPAADRPDAGKCPDCKRIVPVPESAWLAATGSALAETQGTSQQAGARTEDLDAADLQRLEEWASRMRSKANQEQHGAGNASTTSHHVLETDSSPMAAPPLDKMESGLRVCPRCGKPLHMSATACRSCGAPVPRR